LHARTLIDIFDTIESSKELYLNEKNKDKNTKDKNLLIAESHFIFTSPNIGVARFYGPIVMVIEEKGSPRGMDLNSIAKDSKYYSAARLSASPSAAVVSPTTKRSNEKLPDCIQKAWNDYIARLRRKQ
jgi:hypothetical protein